MSPDHDIAFYSNVTISFNSPSVLQERLVELRDRFEIVEVYVRPAGDESVFEPFTSRHLALEGECVVVARRRHPSNEPRIVGIMLAKDEADAVPEIIGALGKQVDALYYFAGDTATAEAIVRHSRPGWARAVNIPERRHADGLRQYLLEQARKDAITDSDPRPMWVMNAQGDEIYHDDLRHHIMLAQAERATVMTCQVATFLLHDSQREGWDWTLPLEQRLTHYIWDFGEHAGQLDFPWTYFDPNEHMRAHPHGMFPGKWATARPVRKHYPFRSPEQAQARIADRLKSGWQPHYENYTDVFMGREAVQAPGQVVKYFEAAGREIKRYHGWFPEAERTGGVW
jgi:hypothetical protein